MELTSDSESHPLIRLPGPPPHKRQWYHCFPKEFLCLPSKGAVLILFWTLVVGAVYQFIIAGSILGTHSFAAASYLKVNHSSDHSNKGAHFEVVTSFVIHGIFGLASFLYPLAGCIADTVIGRYRMVLYSSLFLLCGCVSYSVGSVLYFANVIRAEQATVVDGLKEIAAPLLVGFLLTSIGFSGYQSNYIQLGLDQLLDAPSYSLGLFVHAVEWFMTIGVMLVQLGVACMGTCSFEQDVIRFLVSLPFMFILALCVLMVVGRWKQRWFHTEPVRHNPYKTVFQVIRFSWKHKYPIQYNTFEDGEQASRLDYAKERYGGPFTTEQVEDVKTFLKIFSVLLSLGPVFILTSPTILFYANFIEHVTTLGKTNTSSCSWKWIVLDMGGLRFLVATLFFPVYIWLLYSALRNCIPKIFTRLWIWILILVICVSSIVFIDLTGHVLYFNRKHIGAACMFTHNVMADDDKASRTLQLPWAVVLLPSALQSIAPMMIITTTFEFITAQSPYSMKGFLVGVFLAILGFFQFIGSLILLPFYLPHFWSAKQTSAPIVGCGFGYVLSICTIGIVGFILFLLVSKRYRYRERR